MDQALTHRLALVIPVYDDWQSVSALLVAIDQTPELGAREFNVIIVNDGGHTPDREMLGPTLHNRIQSIHIIDLVCNLGHQRAIAVGLVEAAARPELGGVIVMDGDGEDEPQDIARLLHAAECNPGHIIAARRTQRSESFPFRLFYWAYKLAFLALTGSRIDFGNFCFIPGSVLAGVIYSPSTWNHLAASILRSRRALTGVNTARGRRIDGASKMNVTSLVAHGMSAISVYADIALVRIVLATFAVGALTSLCMLAVIAERLLTNLAIPGWASNVFGSLAIIMLQALVLATVAMFLLLNARSAKPVIPALDAPHFVANRRLMQLAEPVPPES